MIHPSVAQRFRSRFRCEFNSHKLRIDFATADKTGISVAIRNGYARWNTIMTHYQVARRTLYFIALFLLTRKAFNHLTTLLKSIASSKIASKSLLSRPNAGSLPTQHLSTFIHHIAAQKIQHVWMAPTFICVKTIDSSLQPAYKYVHRFILKFNL